MQRRASAFAALALLAALFSPSGFMPMLGQGGAWTIMPCPGRDPLARELGQPTAHAMPGMAHSNGKHDHGDAPSHSGCDFAFVGTLSPPAPLVVTIMGAPPAMAPETALVAPLTGIFPRGLPPATGPPTV